MNRPLLLQAASIVLLWSSVAMANGPCPRTRETVVRAGAPLGYIAPPTPSYPPVHHAVPHTAGHHRVIHPAVTSPPVASRPVRQSVPVPPQPAAPDPAAQITAAMTAFQLGNNHAARVIVDRLLSAVPGNPDLLQFRSLIHLRSGELRPAAFDAYEALKQGSLLNIEQAGKIHGDITRYQNDVRVLQMLAQGDSQDLETHFLAAYHHLVAGNLESGGASLRQVLEIHPGEPLATALVHRIESKSIAPASSTFDPPR